MLTTKFDVQLTWARHGHRRGDVPEDDSDHMHLNISVIFGDRGGLAEYLRECFFSQRK